MSNKKSKEASEEVKQIVSPKPVIPRTQTIHIGGRKFDSWDKVPESLKPDHKKATK